MSRNVIRMADHRRRRAVAVRRSVPRRRRRTRKANPRDLLLGVTVLCGLAFLALEYLAPESDKARLSPISTAGTGVRADDLQVTVRASHVRVIDGDTVEVAGERLRLKGWDTPEIFGSERCNREYTLGLRARQRTIQIMSSAERFTFTREGQDAYGRTVSGWRVDDRDFGSLLASEGLAKRWHYGLQSKPNWCG